MLFFCVGSRLLLRIMSILTHIMAHPGYVEIDCDELNHLFKGDLVLIVTATDLETNATHQRIKPLFGYDKIIKVFEGELTYYFGMMGNYRIAHVQSSMGSLSRDSSIMTVRTAIEKLKAKIVIMVGIAFGVNESKQRIGDVLLAESIIPYNAKRIGKKRTIKRGIEAPSSKVLFNRFKNIKTTWEYFLDGNLKARLIPTRLLSGEELVDNLEHRNKLIADNPDSKGGEMEGAGVFAACDGRADWIIVKGICDFADGGKATEKEARQIIAVNSALSACMEIFNSNSAFKELRVLPANATSTEILKNDLNITNVLFDIYDSSKEPYYLERSQDANFIQAVNHIGIWIYGPVGCGKSNLIIRNLIKSKYGFIQVSLAACIGMTIESFFKEILYDIASAIGGVKYQIQPGNFSECSRAILDLLSKKFKNKALIIFIEEIPISTEEEYKEFAGKIFSLLTAKNLIGGLDKIRFVLSSINSPAGHLQIFQQKIHEQIKFVGLEYWEIREINSLIAIIETEIQFTLPNAIKEELIVLAAGSPRFIKKFFRSIYTVGKSDQKTLKYILKETERELNQFSNA
jgi:nucleoside phosphorylase